MNSFDVARVSTFSPDFWTYFSYLKIIGPILFFLIGIIWILKHEGNKLSKLLSFIIPIIGIILFFVNRKNDKEIASSYLRASIVGCITYILICFLIVALTLIQFTMQLAY